MDIKAAYWEPQIKTYGFAKAAGLLLTEIKGSVDTLERLGHELAHLGDQGIPFHLLFSRVSEGGLITLHLLIQPEWEKNLMEHFRPSSPIGIEVISRVDLLSFQGPHFGDRFGILDAAFHALSSNKVRVIASVCSMSCVYLVLEAGQVERAASALSQAFDVPKAFPLRS